MPRTPRLSLHLSWLLVLATMLVFTSSLTADVLVFGPKTYSIASGRQTATTDSISIATTCQPNAVYTLSVVNGASDGSARVSNARISVNGTVVLGPSDFNQQVATIERTISLSAGANSLAVELTGGPSDGRVAVSIRRHIDLQQSLFAKQYTATTQKTSLDEQFSVSALTDTFSITVRSGDQAGAAQIKNAVVTLNGTKVIDTSDWKGGTTTVTKPVSLISANALHIDADGTGQFAVSVVRHVADTTGPTISTNIPASGTVGVSPFTLSGAVTDTSGLASLTVNGTDVSVAADGTFSTILALQAGTNTLAIVASDCEGNITRNALTIGYNPLPPQLTVVSPVDGAIVLMNSVAVIGSAIGDFAVQEVTINGQQVSLAGTGFSKTITFPPDAHGVSEGARQVVVTATDRAGHQVSVTRNIFVDLTPPTITVQVASDWTNAPVTAQFICADVGSGIATCPAPLTIATEGANQVIHCTTIDLAGRSASVSAAVNLDFTPPLLTLEPLVATTTSADTVIIGGTISDTGSGIRSTTCDGLAASVVNGAFTCTVPIIEGTNTIEVVGDDIAGNRTVRTVVVRRDTVAPVLTVDWPSDGATTNAESVTVSGSAFDDTVVSSITVNGLSAPLAANGAYQQAVSLQEGANVVTAVASDAAGNQVTVVRHITRFSVPTVVITDPSDLAVVGTSTVPVRGMVSDSSSTVVVDGVAAAVSGHTFTASAIPLAQGRTVVTAIATNPAGHSSSGTVHVYRDSIPPRLMVYTPADGATVSQPTADVSGMVDDIVVGTVNAGQVTVDVNGTPATVANRAFLARNVPLTRGTNTLTVHAIDQGGNSATTTVTVVYDNAPTKRTMIVSGNGQTAPIGSTLPDQLTVQLFDVGGVPAANQIVLFTVAENDGLIAAAGVSGKRSLAVTTDAAGTARTTWTLGMRAGAGNNRVVATAAGFGSVAFTAIATPGPPALLVSDAGDHQYGTVDQPLPRPIVVAVVDRGSNRLSGIPVTFAVTQGGGALTGQTTVTVLTDSDGRAWVQPTLGATGDAANVFVASAPGLVHPVGFTAIGRIAGPADQTQITGVVVDNTNTPLPGVSIRIDGTALATQTDAQGQFVLRPVPIGYVKLFVDGTTTQRAGTWPTLEFPFYTISGQNNVLGMPIYLLPIDVARGVQVDERKGGTLTLPELSGFSLQIAPGSATFPNGSRAGTVSATLVHADKVPMQPGFGQQPRFIVTIQPTGVHFDPPAALSFPNVEGLRPGQITELYSFDHDLGQFVAIGTGSVSEDGTVVTSDPGVGIIKGGWHCGGDPQPSGTCDACAGSGPDQACRKSDGTACVPDEAKNGQKCKDDGNPCTEEVCKDGTCQHTAVDVDIFSANTYVDHDNPDATWNDAKALPLGQTLYAGTTAKLGDNVSWKVTTKTVRAHVASVQWVAHGPATISGPSGPEWRVDGLTWQPGFYTIEATVQFDTGCSVTRKWGQDVGVRAPQVTVIGWINPDEVPLSDAGVDDDVLYLFPVTGLRLTGSLTQRSLAVAYLTDIESTGDARRPIHSDQELTPADRHYIINWQFKFGSNSPPPMQFLSAGDIDDVEGEEPGHWKLFNTLQVKYSIRAGQMTNVQTIHRKVRIGWTPDPFFVGFPVPGDAGLWNDRLVQASDRVQLVNDGTPDHKAVREFNVLAAPIIWNNIGSMISEGPAFTTYDVKTQVYPTYWVYEGLELVNIYHQAADPLGNFNLTPYPPGPPFPPYIPAGGNQ